MKVCLWAKNEEVRNASKLLEIMFARETELMLEDEVYRNCGEKLN